MYIKHIKIRKYRHLENLELGPFLAPSDSSDLIVIAGPNGGGKSSVLELISQALANSWSLTYQLNRSAPESSFEVCVGLLPKEVELIKSKSGLVTNNIAVIRYLETNRSYFRSFRYEGGEYDKDQQLQNNIHSCVVTSLKGDYFRPLGFHLGSERSFKKANFDYRNKFFNYTTYSQKNYTWGYAFRTESDQFEDMLDYLITWQHNYFQELGSYHHLKESGISESISVQPPEDRYGKVLSKVFPDYTFVHKTENAPSDLFIRIPSGETIPFSDLSSGEKQVFFTLCFFERHDVEEAVIVIDEPELHLHPSLARLLLRTMQQLKPRNQIWLATQNAEVIDEAGRDRVWFIRRNDETQKAEVIHATDEEPALSYLRDFFGYSGYIGLAKAMIFTEGRNASADRKMFSRLFPQFSREIKFIPASSCSESERINNAVLRLLEANVGWCKFLLVRDRDYMTPEVVATIRERSDGKVHVLQRHEIENYLLHPDAISAVLNDLFSQHTSPAEVEEALKQVACQIAGDVLRDMVSFRLNLIFRPEDFSVPPLFKGELHYKPSDAGWVNEKLAKLEETLKKKSDDTVSDLTSRISGTKFKEVFDSCRGEVECALAGDGWKNLFPGKDLLRGVAKAKELGKPPVLENAIIKFMSGHTEWIPQELVNIIDNVRI